MTKMTYATDPRLVVDRYVSLWSVPDAETRRQGVAELWAPDGEEFVDGGVRFRGHEELAARIAGAYGEFVENGAYTVGFGDDVTVHDDVVMFTVQLVADDEVAWAARVFLVLGEDGLIRQDYQLTVKPLPAQ